MAARKSSIKKAIKNYIKELRNHGIPVNEVILFGSCVRGGNEEISSMRLEGLESKSPLRVATFCILPSPFPPKAVLGKNFLDIFSLARRRPGKEGSQTAYANKSLLCARRASVVILRHRTMDINKLTGEVIGAAIEVHKALGPGLLESVYPVK